MNSWQRWWQAPSTHWLRRALFQVHLWLGIGFGLYLLIISVSGSAIVLRPHIHRWFVHSQADVSAGPALAGAALQQRIAAAYEPARSTGVLQPRRPGSALIVDLQLGTSIESRYFDQHRGVDLGSTEPHIVRGIEWLTLLHDELHLERRGRTLNGIGGLVLLLLLFSGGVLWWQGQRRWREGLLLRSHSTRPLLWQLHSFAGFWAFLLFFAWGLTAVYFAWPLPFDLLMDRFDADLMDAERPDGWLLFLIDLHFGRFRGTLWAACLWTVLGLLPAFMYISGFVLWYRRVLQRRPAGEGVSGQRLPRMP
jgi:uncharacterized iron-regulated membrane protein